ncbi:hypothetical protein RLEG12_18195 [Rhizobium leguminosarum bv. trifolii CB782]|nr:hypothetical protein RLEG12_18195 [Rhizobium leguminosarum bv. trifolii CB782]
MRCRGERQASEPKGAATAAPSRATSTGTVTAFAGSAARKLEPTIAVSTSEIVAFKCDYQEATRNWRKRSPKR